MNMRCALPLAICLLATSVRAETAHSGDDSAQPPETTAQLPERTAHGQVTLFWVPWGTAYARAALGGELKYIIPLIKKPGVLWDSTNITIGVRDLYGYALNRAAVFAEITPIAVFKLRLVAGHDYFMRSFNGGLRVLTPEGRERLSAGMLERGNAAALDWVEGLNNSDVFSPARADGGLRFQIQPTLQAKLGSIAMQYNATVDINDFRKDDLQDDDVFYDNATFTMREMRDISYEHELIIAYATELAGSPLLAGLALKYHTVSSTGISGIHTGMTFFYQPKLGFMGEWRPWAAGSIGTYLSEPMHQYDLSWVLAMGADHDLL